MSRGARAGLVQPAFELLEPRLLLDAQWPAVIGAGASASAARDTTERFSWSGYELAAPLVEAPLIGPPASPAGASAATTVLEYRFDGPVVLEPADAGFVARLAGEEQWVNEFDPVVPVRTSRILLPPGSEIVSVAVDLGAGVVVAEGAELLAASEPVPIYDGADLDVEYTATVATASFPGDEAVTFRTETLAGYCIGVLTVFPVQYDAAGGTVTYHPHVGVTVTTGPSSRQAVGLRPGAADLARVVGLVDNAAAAAPYEPLSGAAGGEAAPAAPLSGPLADDGPYEYVLVTSESLAGTLQELVDHKRSRGLTATIVTTETIYAQYSSPYANENDDAGKVREFIADAYARWGTQYVLLGGDISVVPERRVYVTSGSYKATLCTDMYFACLDGPYNFTDDTHWAQSNDGDGGGDVDFTPELAVGRAPVETVAEATNFVAKTVFYETTPHANATHSVLIGQKLDASPLTWGGDSCDYIAENAFPASAEITRLYARDGTFSSTAVKNALNASPHFMNHLGHSSSTSNSGLYRSDVDALTNEYAYVFYSQGCKAGQFEVNDAIAEHHLKAPHAGVAAIMNSHYGWYSPGVPSGSGTQWALAFWNALFDENILPIGEAHIDAKMDRLGTIGSTGSGRWLFFGSTLFGDPETHFYFPREGPPRVVAHDPEGDCLPARSHVRFRFGEPMDTRSFSVADDLVSFTGPGGRDLADQITGFLWRDFFTLDVFFRPQAGRGTYEMTIGPNVLDATGQALDQDGDGTPGEADDDRYRAEFTVAGADVVDVLYEADMDADPGWTLDPGSGDYQWQWGKPIGLYSDPTSGHTGENVLGYNLRGLYDHNMSPEHATMPSLDCRGYANVTLSFQRWLRVHQGAYDRASIEVSAGGGPWTTVWENDGALYDKAWREQTLDLSWIADGQADVRIRWGMGPTNDSVAYGGWNLDDVFVTAARDHPAVVTHAPSGEIGAGFDHVDVFFSTAIDPATLTAEDVSLTGPAGAIDVTGITHVEGNTYRLHVEPQDALGTYELALGPDVANAGGFAMDQDADGIGGEAGDDVYRGSVAIILPDTDGPAVAYHTPSGSVLHAPGALRFVFDEDMDTGSFSLADVVSFTGPGGTDLRGQITSYRWQDARTLEVAFQPQHGTGLYTMVLGPDIADDPPGGNRMDQNGNGICGEGDDAYTASFELSNIDLYGKFLAIWPNSLDSGDGTTVASFRIRNDGGTDAGPFRVRFYLSEEDHIDPEEDILLVPEAGGDAFEVAQLPAGGETYQPVRLVVPSTDPFGANNDYYVGMIVDADGDIAETNEDNNVNRGLGLDMIGAYYGRILGTVWHDADADAIRDGDEEPLAFHWVYLDHNDNGVRDEGEPRAMSEIDGGYLFRYLDDGHYVVRLEPKDGWVMTHPGWADAFRVTLVPGETVEFLNFGVCQPVTVSGAVFEDVDSDGIWDGDEAPLPGRRVYVDANDSGTFDDGEAGAETGPDGRYRLEGLLPGALTIRQEVPDGWFLTSPEGGAHRLTLRSGESSDNLNFGNIDNRDFRDPDTVEYPAQGLRFAYYHHSRPVSADDLDALVPEFTGVAANFDLAGRERNEDFGFLYSGYVHVDRDGMYSFYTASDDASLLYVGETLVVDNDGYHAAQERSGQIGLKAGDHAITLKYLQGTGEHSLTVSYEGSGLARAVIPDAALLYSDAPDVAPPGLRRASAVDATHVSVAFNEALDTASAETAANYQMDPVLGVESAVLEADLRTVTLTLAGAMLAGRSYTVTVHDVTDLAGNPIEAGSQAGFVFSGMDPDLLVWWTFDEGEGAEAGDSTGRGRRGQVSGPEWVADGRLGGALRFNGGLDLVEDADGEDYLNGLDGLTVAMWLKADAEIVGDTDAGFFTTRQPGNKECVNFRYDEDGYHSGSSNTYKIYVQTDEKKNQLEGEAFSQTSDWQHFVVAWASGGPIRLYLDGAAQELTYDLGDLGGRISAATTLIVGQGCKAAQPWLGLIDDVQVYGRALDEVEIRKLANLESVAAADAYEVDEDGALAVEAADGVLANDTDPDGGPQPLTAALLADASHGMLTLAADGSFEYVPAPGYEGADSFTYRAFDGLEYGNVATVSLDVVPVPKVEGRYVFYNHCRFDDPALGGDDDAAVASDKEPLLPGETATFANYTSYRRGINGIMVDISHLPADELTGDDFAFRVGNDDNPAGWGVCTADPVVTVRRGAGVDGTDRVTLVWEDNQIEMQWLQVTVEANAGTGLAAADVFYFGNAIGESGNSATDAFVNATDEIQARSHPHNLFMDPAPIDDAYDYDRDRRVNATDQLIARGHKTFFDNALKLITVPGEPVPAGPEDAAPAAPPEPSADVIPPDAEEAGRSGGPAARSPDAPAPRVRPVAATARLARLWKRRARRAAAHRRMRGSAGEAARARAARLDAGLLDALASAKLLPLR